MWIHKTIPFRCWLLELATVYLLIAGSFTAECQNAGRSETKVVSIESLGKTPILLQPGGSQMIEVVQDENHLQETFPGDWLVLRVKDQNQKLVASKPFHSSYQKFHIDIVDLDGDGRKEFIFTLGEGRGTSARRETLYVEHFEDFHFKQVLATPLSDFYASGRKWWYLVEFKSTEGGRTTDLVLRLRVDDDPTKNLPQGTVPTEQTKIFTWRNTKQAGAKSASKELHAEFQSLPQSQSRPAKVN